MHHVLYLRVILRDTGVDGLERPPAGHGVLVAHDCRLHVFPVLQELLGQAARHGVFPVGGVGGPLLALGLHSHQVQGVCDQLGLYGLVQGGGGGQRRGQVHFQQPGLQEGVDQNVEAKQLEPIAFPVGSPEIAQHSQNALDYETLYGGSQGSGVYALEAK